MAKDFQSLTSFQLDALQEIGNIGAGNAATALSKLIGERVDMGVPRIDVRHFSEVPEIVGGPESYVAGVFIKISGSAPGVILLLFPVEDAKQLISILLKGHYQARSQQTLDQLETSALMEVGNILAGSFLNALAIITSLKYTPSVPGFCADMAGAILGTVLHDAGIMGDNVLYIKTELRFQAIRHVRGYLFFLPEAESLETILTTLGVNS